MSQSLKRARLSVVPTASAGTSKLQLAEKAIRKWMRSWVAWLVGLMFVAALATAGAVRAQAPQLLEQYKCTFCHSEREAKTGPAFVEIAASYKGNAKAVDLLAAVVRKGSHGGGPWHMPPHPEVSEADAKVMVRYILSQQK